MSVHHGRPTRSRWPLPLLGALIAWSPACLLIEPPDTFRPDPLVAGGGSQSSDAGRGNTAGGTAQQAGRAGAADSDGAGAAGDGGSGMTVGGSSGNGGSGGDGAAGHHDSSGGSGGGVGSGGSGGGVGSGGRSGAGDSGAGGSAGAGGAPPAFPNGNSCVVLDATCGPSGNTDCCDTKAMPGGTFNRSNDAAYPATISGFRLDTFEVTVGRFRKFVAVHKQTLIPAAAGANPNDAADTGWDPSWNAQLSANANDLQSALLSCNSNSTWTAQPGTPAQEARAINCVNWYEAFAFCIWDGGRLPTEAEWNYAASGGAEQRVYPWGSAPPDAAHAVYDSTGVEPVGSHAPTGNAKWGQADLAGNVAEWTQDWYGDAYPTPCRNCAQFTVGDAYRVVRGGDALGPATDLTSMIRRRTAGTTLAAAIGIRCARAL